MRALNAIVSIGVIAAISGACATAGDPDDMIPDECAYPWPGNVRELQNVIERAVITDRGGPLSFDLPEGGTPRLSATTAATDSDVLSEEEMKRFERDNVLRALEQTRWHVYGPTGAASLLGIKPTTLASRMKRMGLARG